MPKKVLRDPRVGLAGDVLGISVTKVMRSHVSGDAGMSGDSGDQRDEGLWRRRLEPKLLPLRVHWRVAEPLGRQHVLIDRHVGTYLLHNAE